MSKTKSTTDDRIADSESILYPLLPCIDPRNGKEISVRIFLSGKRKRSTSESSSRTKTKSTDDRIADSESILLPLLPCIDPRSGKVINVRIRLSVERKRSTSELSYDTSPSSREGHSYTTSESFSRKKSRQSTEEESSKSIRILVYNEETKKMIVVFTSLNDTIGSLKSKIEDEENIPTDHQCLLWKENELQDGDKLSEHNIEQDSLLVLKELLVKLTILNEKTHKVISLDVHPSDTIQTIKKKIEDQANVPFDIQCLMWKDDELQDSKKLSEYDIEEDSLLVLKQCISL